MRARVWWERELVEALTGSLSFQAHFAEGEALPLSEKRPSTADRCL